MVTYEFYVNSYLGSAIPEKLFPEMAARAADALRQLQRIYTVTSSGEVSRNMALCAMAECIYEDARHRGIRSSTVGSVSVHYDESARRRELANLLERAAIYLDICRGVG